MPTRKKKPAMQKTPAVKRKSKAVDGPKCGLCGKKKNLVRTECCGQWICNDEDKYVLFSYSQNSCHRNHRRMTLCGYHHGEGHKGKWQDCKKAGLALSPRWSCGMARTNSISRRCPIRHRSCQSGAGTAMR